jgi:excisionase family DNA binding protein
MLSTPDEPPPRKSLADVKHYSIREVADILRVHYKTARLYVLDGRLAAIRVGTRRRVTESALDKFCQFDPNEAGPAAPAAAPTPPPEIDYAAKLRAKFGDRIK